jgi:AcrR family transcriptional regulator
MASDEHRADRVSVRERLLAAADELFYAQGVHSVGIDRVIELAGVAKASLYRTFGSKEELVAAYLAARHEAIREQILQAVEQENDPRARLLAVFAAECRWLGRVTYRGCSFTRASAESSAGERVHYETASYRQDVRDILTQLATEANVPDPAALGMQLFLLYQGGSIIEAGSQQLVQLSALRRAAETLVDAALVSSPQSS